MANLSRRLFAVVVTDLRMTGRDGTWLLEQALATDPDVAVIIATADNDVECAVDCLTRGAVNYLVKPIALPELIRVVDKAVTERRHRLESCFYRLRLEDLVRKRTAELQATVDALERSYRDSIYRLAIAAEYRDEETGNHIVRMAAYSHIIALQMGMDEDAASLLLLASPMHDVGKIGISDDILLKPGRLTAAEYAIMQTHTRIGARILAGSDSPLLQLAEVIALTHHEWFDGNGYPERLQGCDIPLAGRITAMADAFDAMTSKRIYKQAMPVDLALRTIEGAAGTQFDPDVVEAFFGSLDEILEVRHGLAEDEAGEDGTLEGPGPSGGALGRLVHIEALVRPSLNPGRTSTSRA